MNWYKAKVAVVVEPEPEQVYMSIGHHNYYDPDHEDSSYLPPMDWYDTKPPEIEQLWIIDNGFRIHTENTTAGITHNDVAKFPIENCLSSGRYTKNDRYPNGLCSAVMDNYAENPLTPQRIKWLQERTTRILEKQYGPDVKIMFFDI